MQIGIALLLILAAIVVAMFVRRSMNEQAEDEVQTFLIKRGHTLSTRKVRLCSDRLMFTTIFPDSSWYASRTYMGNVLYGTSFGFDSAYNSIAIYWRCVLDKETQIKLIKLYFCVKARGEKKKGQYLCDVELNEEVFFRIQKGERDDKTDLTIIYKGERLRYVGLPRCEQSTPKFIIFPRFRDGKAPHDIKIFITNNKFELE